MTPFPWADVMAFGLGVLRLPPDAFWRMTLREIAGAAGMRSGERALDRTAFDILRGRFPDGVLNE
ncbi:hypothetical protein GJW-30_1_03779 [Variibacter gotjawalensis]|uniref:Phage tail assembly chaperone n=1 Tax=Variibacter gotjawalensis TaxID=1333996 RepID=A0A0S3PZ68_9BRAD|nr:rcc01693 family protein [Variibacter gotjawalensis]NIK47059.1 putative phage protein (TIGR02216 family) [Variibacter gotjawalensis]RZS48964.1 putative phage protein (TIGR02216 family) [Variibacter gotjawalensis]BAT61222.1 hypothetical protein GJW-30_1_03779 [Variibacter gotjawalensis]